MISIEKVAEVHRLFYVEHMTINAIAKHLGLHHDSVERTLSPEKFRNKRYKGSKLDIFEQYIAETVDQYPRIKAPRLTELLRDRGYVGSVSNVRRYVRSHRKRHYQAYLRLEHFPGEQAQVDWADFGKVKVEGGHRRISCFVMVLSHSRVIFARFGFDQTLENFLLGHIEAFTYFNGVARSILYDNLKSAVIERLEGHIKFNRHLTELAVHYRFSPKACQPYAGNQKEYVPHCTSFVPLVGCSLILNAWDALSVVFFLLMCPLYWRLGARRLEKILTTTVGWMALEQASSPPSFDRTRRNFEANGDFVQRQQAAIAKALGSCFQFVGVSDTAYHLPMKLLSLT